MAWILIEEYFSLTVWLITCLLLINYDVNSAPVNYYFEPTIDQLILRSSQGNLVLLLI